MECRKERVSGPDKTKQKISISKKNKLAEQIRQWGVENNCEEKLEEEFFVNFEDYTTEDEIQKAFRRFCLPMILGCLNK